TALQSPSAVEKPMIENNANAASRAQSRRAGSGGRAQSKVRAANAAATSERAKVTNSGSKSATARRVAGKDDNAEHAEQKGLALAVRLAAQPRVVCRALWPHPRLPPNILRAMTTRMISLVPSKI